MDDTIAALASDAPAADAALFLDFDFDFDFDFDLEPGLGMATAFILVGELVLRPPLLRS